MPDDPDDPPPAGAPDAGESPPDVEEFFERSGILLEQNLVEIGLVREDGFLHANHRLAAIHGYDREEFLEVDPVELVPEGRHDELAADALALLEGEVDEATYSGPVRRKDGSTAHVEVHLRRARHRGEDAFVSMTVDVTDRVRQARALEVERERLDFLNAMLRHHVLNGMNVVIATAERLAAEAEGERRRRLDTIRRRGTAIVDLVGTIRSLVRTIQRDEAAGFGPVDLDATLRRSIEAVEADHEDATVTVEGIDAGLSVSADAMLETAFEDLIDNAIRHNDQPDPEVRVRVEADEGTVSVHVEDGGPGIPDSVRRDVFDDGTTGERSGFGLHVVRLLVTLYDGSLSISDRDPRGSVVTVTLPRATQADG